MYEKNGPGRLRRFCSTTCRTRSAYQRLSPEQRAALNRSKCRLTCADCAKPMFRGKAVLPQGQATCQPCRKLRTKKLRTKPQRVTRIWNCDGCNTPTSGGNGNSRLCPDCKTRKRDAHNSTRGHRRRARLYGVHYEYVSPHTIYERDGWCCGICRKKVDRALEYPHPKSASLDHVLPISLGGDHVPANLQCTHLDCNVAKSNRGAPQQLALIG